MTKHPQTPNWVIPVPPHTTEEIPWRQVHRGGTRDDRMCTQVTTSLPPKIADYLPVVSAEVCNLLEEAAQAVSTLEADHGQHLGSLAALLVRTESVASSKIEHIQASITDYARALHGSKANPSATSMAASATALVELVNSANPQQAVTLSAITDAHAVLMADDPHELPYAGRLRAVQNWIGGSDFSPRNALFVPPPPELVPDYLADLLSFSRRTDLSAVVQCAVAHAHFESIHPFIDGNGRIGRALINAGLRYRGSTKTIVVPLASALVADRDRYFAALTAYRAGDAGPIVALVAQAIMVAAKQSSVTAQRLAELPDQWLTAASSPRAGSAARTLVTTFFTNPIMSAEEAFDAAACTSSRGYAALNRLRDAGVITALTDRTRNQIWAAADLLAELTDLNDRIGAAIHAANPPKTP